MAVTVVQTAHAGHGAVAGGYTVTLGAAPTEGNQLVAIMFRDRGSEGFPTITGWTLVDSDYKAADDPAQFPGPGGAAGIALYKRTAQAGDAAAIFTAPGGGYGYAEAWVIEVAGCLPDQTLGYVTTEDLADGGNRTHSLSVGPYTPNGDGMLIFATAMQTVDYAQYNTPITDGTGVTRIMAGNRSGTLGTSGQAVGSPPHCYLGYKTGSGALTATHTEYENVGPGTYNNIGVVKAAFVLSPQDPSGGSHPNPVVGTTHHLKVGEGYFLVKPYTYRRQAAPLFGARFTTGDPDYNNLSFWQHWVQRCWIGGLGQELWNDDAMFDEAVGVDTSLHDRMQLSRDLVRGAGSGWTLHAKRNATLFAIYGNELYALQINGLAGSTREADTVGELYKYNNTTDAWSSVKTFANPEYLRSIYVWNGHLLIGTSANFIHRYDGTTWTQMNLPAADTSTVYSMFGYRDRLYVGLGSGKIWRMKTDWSWDGSTFFFENPGLGGYVLRMEQHLGYLYMLTNGPGATVLRTDGNNTFEIWRFPEGTIGSAIRSYDGKLFIQVNEPDGTDTTIGADTYRVMSQAAIYQLSGSAMTELKRWGKVGDYSEPAANMVVHDRRLYYGAPSLFGMESGGFGIAVYDAVEDAHSIFASNRDTASYADTDGDGYDYRVSDIIVYRGRMFIAVGKHGVFRTPVTFRDYMLSRAEASYDITGSDVLNNGWLVSSEFDAGTPGLQKLWQKLTLDCDLPHSTTSVKLDYSTDGGTTWTNALTVAGTTATGRQVHEKHLQNIRAYRIKYRLRLKTTSADYTPVVYGVSFSYLPQPEPNFQWQFVMPVSELQHTLDDTDETIDVQQRIEYLEGLYRTQEIIAFTDIDGREWARDGLPGVLVQDYRLSVGIPEQEIEGDVHITLIEAVEEYEA